MRILNYATRIDASVTAGEIVATLLRAGAASAAVEHDGNQPVAVTFVARLASGEPVTFRLPAKTDVIHKRLARARYARKMTRSREQAGRVTWRTLKFWVDAQVAVVDSGLAGLAELFFPYAVSPAGKSIFQVFESTYHLLETAP